MANARAISSLAPDYAHWSQMARWTWQDAAALSLGLDPTCVTCSDTSECLIDAPPETAALDRQGIQIDDGTVLSWLRVASTEIDIEPSA